VDNNGIKETSFVPNRIDRDPNVMLGITAPELNAIAWLALPAFIIFAIAGYIIFDSFIRAILSGAFGVVMVLFGSLFLLIAVKRNKPPHYILHMKFILLDKLGLKKAPFIYKSERFSATDDD